MIFKNFLVSFFSFTKCRDEMETRLSISPGTRCHALTYSLVLPPEEVLSRAKLKATSGLKGRGFLKMVGH